MDYSNYGQYAEAEAKMFGWQRPDSQWLITNVDTIVLNPHYNGPDQPHPYDQEYEDEMSRLTDAEKDALLALGIPNPTYEPVYLNGEELPF
jgi:hypothetical protein